MRIIFFGTPEFAVASLQALVEAKMDVVAVVTAPDKPAGRGQQIQSSPVKIYAESCGLAVLQPLKLKDPAFLQELASYQADALGYVPILSTKCFLSFSCHMRDACLVPYRALRNLSTQGVPSGVS
jgi:hypothetical protein